MSINLELEKKILNLITSFNQNLFDDVIKDASDLYKEINNISVIPNLIGASYAGKNNHENAVIFYKKALAIDAPVYATKIVDKERPIKAENSQKESCPAE